MGQFNTTINTAQHTVAELPMSSLSRGAVIEHGHLIQIRPRPVRNFDSLESQFMLNGG